MNVLKSAGERYDSILFHTRHCLKGYFLTMITISNDGQPSWRPGIIGDPVHWRNGVVEFEEGIVNVVTGVLTGRARQRRTSLKYGHVIKYATEVYLHNTLGNHPLNENGIKQAVAASRMSYMKDMKNNFNLHWFKDFRKIMKWKTIEGNDAALFNDVNEETAANSGCWNSSKPLLDKLLIRIAFTCRMRGAQIKTPRLFCTGSISKKRCMPLDTKGLIELFSSFFTLDFLDLFMTMADINLCMDRTARSAGPAPADWHRENEVFMRSLYNNESLTLRAIRWLVNQSCENSVRGNDVRFMIWNTFFKIESRQFRGKMEFDGYMTTDGVRCNFKVSPRNLQREESFLKRHVEIDLLKSLLRYPYPHLVTDDINRVSNDYSTLCNNLKDIENAPSKKRKRSGSTPTAARKEVWNHVGDLDLPSRQEFMDRNLVGIDPNMRDIIYCTALLSGLDGPRTHLRYTSMQRRMECGFKHAHIFRRNLKSHNSNITAIETDLSVLSNDPEHPERSYIDSYTAFHQRACVVRNTLYNYYSQDQLMYLKWKVFRKTQRSDAKLTNAFKEKFGNQAVALFGDWNGGETRRFQLSTKGVGMRRTFRQAGISVVLVNECNTSKKCYDCQQVATGIHTFLKSIYFLL